jgi:DNA helicase-2/ATP-dependent DNA helicase PcrA
LEVVALQADTDKLNLGNEVVTLMTLHAAKGLEFRTVYITAVEENILPHSRSKNDPTQLEEERRLLCVGITRAQDQLQLSYAKSRGFGGSSGSGVPSSFLLELPKHEMQFVDHCERSHSDEYSGEAGFDEYFDSSSGDFDDACQLAPEDEQYVEFDDTCQLSPDEAKQAMLKKAKQAGNHRLSTGSQLATTNAWGKFRKGALVSHPEHGSGEITEVSGHGPKRSVTVYFFDSSQERTFRLSHAQLTIQPG